ncbi:MAG: DegV family EDD domain-containing protein [Clostridiales bacterium]|nr:DegV family EDD domain-containing protein [Clostridiales bacterium]
MREVLRYIFRHSSVDPVAERSVYKSSVKPTLFMIMLCIVVSIVLFILTFFIPNIFDNKILFHRIMYAVLFMIGLSYTLSARYALRDYDRRYRIIYVVNVLLALMMFIFVLTLAYSGYMRRGTVDSTLFMTASLLVPLCIYMKPLQYIVLAVISNSTMTYFLYQSVVLGTTNKSTGFYNFIIFTVFQLFMGIVMLYTKYRLHKEIVTAERQHDEIEMLNKAQNGFFSNMSHEIRTPINTIIGLNEMILREDVSEEVIEDAVNIRAAGKLLLSLINDILDMSKFQSGKMQLLEAPYRTGDMLSEIVGMLWIRAKEKKLDFHVDVSPDIPAELNGDEVRIKQILINIINNAIKYTKEGSVSLSVQCDRIDDKTCNMIYTVTDTGIGIKPEDIPYLFSAFKRVDESSNKHIEGTGLGLSIVKQLVDLMGGKITVNSVYMRGSTFIVELPQLIEGETQVGQYNFEKSSAASHKTEYAPKFVAPDARILVVDDNEANLMVASKLLRDTKIRIDTAMSGSEALRKTLNVRYDVIFMDHLMPEMDGIQCYKKIKDQTGGRSRESKVVVLTANADEENRALYARENFDGYLSKPVSGDELENELYRLLPNEMVQITGNRSEIAEETISWMNSNRKRKRVVIATDSVADLPQELLDRYEIASIPHKVITDAGVFKDGKEIDTLGLLRYMEDPNKHIKTDAPDVREYEEFFANLLKSANNVIHISISSRVENSGCHVAREAANAFDNVIVYDSSHLSSGQGLIVLEACKMAEEDKSPDEIVKGLDRVKKKIHTSFIVDNLDFLARAGQVGNKTANLVKSLMGRPVLVLKKGKMGVGITFFGDRESAWKRYINTVLSNPNNIDDKVLFVTYVGLNKRDTDWIREQIEKKMQFKELYFKQAAPAIAVNSGPGTFGLLYREKDDILRDGL